MDTYICYKITNTINGKLYIGQTRQSLESRWKQHIGYATWNLSTEQNINILHKALKKYGIDAFTIEIIGTTTSPEEINLMEQQYIDYYQSHFGTNKGYNMTLGGEGTIGYIFTEADRLKMSLAQLGKIHGPHTKETKQKMSDTKKAKGHSPSVLCRQRKSETSLGIPRDQETKDKIRNTLKGRKRPPEVIERMKEAKRLKKRVDDEHIC